MCGPSAKTICVLVAAVTFLAGIVVAILAFYRPPLHVRVVDPRFHVLSTVVAQGTDGDVYMGNQLEGRARDFLRFRTRLPVKPLPNLRRLAMATGRPLENNTFAILFSWESAQALRGIQAELVDSSGTVRARSLGNRWHFPGNGPFIAIWHLDDFGRTNPGSCRLRLKWVGGENEWMAAGVLTQTNWALLAEVEIRNLPAVLPKHHNFGPNEF